MGLFDKLLKKEEQEVIVCKSCGVTLNKFERKSSLRLCNKCYNTINREGTAGNQNIKNKEEKIEEEFDLHNLQKLQKLVLFLSRYNYFPIGSNNEYYYSDKFITDLNYRNPQLYHKYCVMLGYFCDPSVHDVLHKMTVKELEKIMKQLELKPKGNKNDLIEQIKANISVSAGEQILKHEYYYVLSEGAKRLVDDYYDLIQLYANRDFGISLEVYHAYRTKTNSSDFYIVAYEALKGLIIENRIKERYEMLKKNLIALMKISDRFREYEDALYYAIQVCILDLNRLDQYEILKNTKDKKMKKMFLNQPSTSAINFTTRDAIQMILKHGNYYQEDEIDKAYQDLALPYSCFNVSDMKQLVHEMICDQGMNYDKYGKIACDRFKEYVKKNRKL